MVFSRRLGYSRWLCSYLTLSLTCKGTPPPCEKAEGFRQSDLITYQILLLAASAAPAPSMSSDSTPSKPIPAPVMASFFFTTIGLVNSTV